MAETVQQAKPRPVAVRDIPLVFVQPRGLFRRVEDVAAWRWPLVILLALVTLVGYATVQTGLIDRQVDQQVWQRIAAIDAQQRNVVQRSELRDLYQNEYEMGAFWKVLNRIRAVVVQPARVLAGVLVIAAVLYGVVALTGRKPEWNTLLTICVYASFIEALRLVVLLGLMLQYRTLDVDTSPARLVWFLRDDEMAATTLAAAYGALSALDPFYLWFWGVVIVGLSATRQLVGWRAWLVCGLCWLAGGVGRVALVTGTVAQQGAASTG